MLPNTKDTHQQILYVDEFSLPPYFFDKEFLNNTDLCEPHVKEKYNPGNDPLRKQIGLSDESQKYRC
jgi:hypothetical protein